MNGKHIELFLIDGEPGGLTTVEIAGWSGHLLAGPRSELAKLLKRQEMQRNGSYLLLGQDDGAVGGVRCYVGRTENFAQRLRDHDAKKDFWDQAVIISSKDDSFNEGRWGYLEARLVELAEAAQRSSLPNIQKPQARKLSEAQASDMEAFLRELQTILPVLGVNILRGRKTAQPIAVAAPEASPVFGLRIDKRGVSAQAQMLGNEFTVLEGSTTVASWSAMGTAASTRRSYASYREQHRKLVADGSIVVDGAVGRFTRDVAFASPSTAGAVVSGRSCNGRKEWTWDGGTYEDWESRGVED